MGHNIVGGPAEPFRVTCARRRQVARAASNFMAVSERAMAKRSRKMHTHPSLTHTHTLPLSRAHTRNTLNMHVTRIGKRRSFIIDNEMIRKQPEQVQYIKLRVKMYTHRKYSFYILKNALRGFNFKYPHNSNIFFFL